MPMKPIAHSVGVPLGAEAEPGADVFVMVRFSTAITGYYFFFHVPLFQCCTCYLYQVADATKFKVSLRSKNMQVTLKKPVRWTVVDRHRSKLLISFTLICLS